MLPEMNDDEVYPTPPVAPPVTAPVALVTMEIRHPATDSLTESTGRELKHLLADLLPIERQAQDMSWGMVAPGAAPTPTAERFVRYVNRDNTVAASMKTQATVIETTNYTSFEALCDIAMRVVDARTRSRHSLGWNASACAMSLRSGFRSAWMAVSSGATGSPSRCLGRSASLPTVCP